MQQTQMKLVLSRWHQAVGQSRVDQYWDWTETGVRKVEQQDTMLAELRKRYDDLKASYEELHKVTEEMKSM
jgi:transcriptional accessory protein Tex/SPT6